MRGYLVVLISMLLVACTKFKKPTNVLESDTTESADTATGIEKVVAEKPYDWVQSSFDLYLSSYDTQTYFRDTIQRNSRTYLCIQIYHMLEHHVVTDQWVYIDTLTHAIYEYDLPNDSLIVWAWPMQSIDTSASIPHSGFYTYSMAYAEWMGKSMGVKVKVRILNDSIKIFYDGVGNLDIPRGTLLEEGKIRKHKSTGFWIISNDEEDVYSSEVGGCSDGPVIIDFRYKMYWTC